MKTFPGFLTAASDMSRLTLEAMAEVTLEAAGADGKMQKQPRFDMMAYSGDMLSIGWGGPVFVDMAGLKATDNITVLLDHDRAQIVGQGVAEISAKQCKVHGKVTGDYEDKTSPAGKVVLHAKNGFQWPCSIGADVRKIEEIREGQKVNVNGRNVQGPAIVVRAALLREVSFVSVGGDSKATAKVAASAAKENVMDPKFLQYLKACGKDVATLSEEEKAKMQASFDGLKAAGLISAEVKPVEPVKVEAEKVEAADSTTALRAEAKRLTGIGKFLAKYPELHAKAIDENWSVEKAELQAEIQAELTDLRNSRPKAPMVFAHSDPKDHVSKETVEAALCMKYAVGESNAGKSLVAAYGQENVNKAETLRRWRPSAMFRQLYAQSGIALPNEVGSPEYIRAAFSGSDIGATILGAVANKALAAVIAEPNWLVPRLFGRASHSNFHSHTVYSLAVNGDLEAVSQTGELQHMSMDDENWTRQLTTRGALLGITRQDLINDDLGAFTRSAATFARKAMNTREKVGFTLIMASGAGSSHFTVARANYLTGATSALGTAGLARAVAAFRNLTGPDGDPVNVEPAILLVGPTLEVTGQGLLAPNSVNIIATGVGSSRVVEPSSNIYSGRYGGRPAVGPYLETTITGHSTAYWYLFADPSILPCYEIAYLNGQESPTIEFFGLDQNVDVLGVTWRVYYDFGVAAAEWRAGVKCAGA